MYLTYLLCLIKKEICTIFYNINVIRYGFQTTITGCGRYNNLGEIILHVHISQTFLHCLFKVIDMKKSMLYILEK